MYIINEAIILMTFPLSFNIDKFWENYIFLADYSRNSPDLCVCLSSKKYHQCSYVKILLYHKFPVKICSQWFKVLWKKSSIYLAFSLRCLILLHTVIILIFYASWVPSVNQLRLYYIMLYQHVVELNHKVCTFFMKTLFFLSPAAIWITF